MMSGWRPLGITEGVENCGTVGVTEVVGSSVGNVELDEESGTVMSVGVSVKVNGSMGCGDSGTVMSARVSLEVTGSADCLSGIVELDEDSRTVVSAGVSMEVTGSADRLSLV